MIRQRGLLPVGIAALLVIAGGTAWAVSQNDQASRGMLAPTSGTLAQGAAPSGGKYVLSRIDPELRGMRASEGFCTEISTPAAAAQACHPVPDEDGRIDDQPLRPSMALLGTDRFFAMIAPEGVTAMEIRVEGEPSVARSKPVDAGPAGELLVAILGGPAVTSRDPASSRQYEVRLVDEAGNTVDVIAMSDPS